MEPDGPRVHPSGAPGPPPSRNPRPAFLAAIAAVAIIAGFWLFAAGDEPTAGSSPPSAPSVTTSVLTGTAVPGSMVVGTPWALIFDDGLDGVIVVDPNDPIGHSTKVEGQRAGDQPYRLGLVDNRLVVGWEEIYSVDLNSGESNLLGEATIFVPAAEPGRVWLISYPGGSIGSGTPQAWQVSVLGEVLTPEFEIETDGNPAIGVAAGLAIESDAGILIWDIAEGQDVGTLGSGPSFVSDTTFGHGTALAWCSDPCVDLHITDIPSMDDLAFSHPGQGTRFIARAARFSGDGRYLAAPTEAGDLVVFDRDTERSHIGFSLPPSDSAHLEWAPSTYELFATSLLQNGRTTRIAYQMLGTGRPETIDVSISLGTAFVVVTEEEARSFLGQSTG